MALLPRCAKGSNCGAKIVLTGRWFPVKTLCGCSTACSRLKLFQPEGTTVSAWIRARRLEGARRDLGDPEFAGLTIAALAARWGFSDPARFSRAFRAVYGCSPTEARAVATMRRLDWA